MKKKLILTAFLLSALACARAQTLSQLIDAVNSGTKAVQAIHTYPAEVDDGKCHWVPVTAISISDGKITITETWHTMFGSATTVLTGTYSSGFAKGNWSSNFSSGDWSYDFNTFKGQWNKTQSSQETFDQYYLLRFRIVNKEDVKDGPYDCN